MSNPKNDINFLRVKLKRLEGFKTSANTDLIDLKSFKTNTGIDLTDLKSFKTNTGIDLTDLKSFKTNTGIDLTDLKSFKTNTGIDLTDLKGFKTTANTDLTDLKGFKTTANTDLTDLKSFKTNAGLDLTDLKSFKTNANIDLSDLKGFKASANTDLIDLKGFKTTTNTDLTDLKSFKTSTNTDLTGLKSFKTGLENGTSIPVGLSNTFRTAAQVSNDIAGFNFDGGANPTVTPISRFNSVSQSHTQYTGSYNNFSSSHGFKLSSIAFSAAEEGAFKFASLAAALKTSFFAAANDPTTGYDKGKWYFTNTFPSGNADYKLSSYSYQGYDTQERYNKEDFITYRKRLYTVTNNAYSNVINQESELLLQAGKTTIRAGTPNNTTPTLKIIGESAASNGVGDDQGQLLLQDEDNTTSGLMIGYKYVAAGNEYGRIQAKNSAGSATDLYINPAGGSVRIGRLNNNYVTDGAIELNYYGAGNRNSFIDFHSDDYYGYPGGNPSAGGDGDYSGRVIRYSGTDGMMQIENKGSGGIRNKVSYGGSGNIFDWYVDNTRLMFVKSTGQLWVKGGTTTGAGINVWNGDVALNLGHHHSNENAGRIQVKSAGLEGTIGETNYILKLNPDGGTVYSNNGIVSTSDERIKYDIKESILGLEFINKIKPVSYKYKIRDITYATGSNGEEVKIQKTGVRPHYGFIAQQIKEALGENDFAGYIYEPSLDEHALRYDEFISPMVKAIQELSQKNDYLQKELEEKDKLLQDILSRLSSLENK